MGKIVEQFELLELLCETNNSLLYKAKLADTTQADNQYQYVLKQIKSPVITDDMVYREMENSQKVYNYASGDIAIPVERIVKDLNGCCYEVMRFETENRGLFLGKLMEKLEEKYDKKIPLSIQFRILQEILKSLGILHRMKVKNESVYGYLHLDLHPGNIYVTNVDLEDNRIGSVKFIDFMSMIPLNECGYGERDTELISCTAGFSSPQLFDENLRFLDKTSDLYAVSAIGKRMYTGMQLQHDFWNDDAYRFLEKKKNSILDNMYAKLIEDGMEYNTANRYQTVGEMQESLQRIMKCEAYVGASDYYPLFETAFEWAVPQKAAEKTNIKWNHGTFCSAVRKLEDALHQNNINNAKCYYIYSLLRKIEYTNSDKIETPTKFKLADSGIAVNNHLVHQKELSELVLEIEKYKEDIPVVDDIGVMTRIAEIYSDSLNYKKAYEIVSKNIAALEAIKSSYKTAGDILGVRGEDAVRMKQLARAYSAAGRYLAFLGQYEKAASFFQKALKEFGEDKGNRSITLSHILHMAIQQSDRQSYEKYAADYFGQFEASEEGMIMCWQMIEENLKHGRESAAFQGYLLLKGIDSFYTDILSDRFAEILKKSVAEDKFSTINQYPMNHIYKYMGRILYRLNPVQNFSIYKELIIKSTTLLEEAVPDGEKPFTVLMLDNCQSIWNFNIHQGKPENNREVLKLIRSSCSQTGAMDFTKQLAEIEGDENFIRHKLDLLRYEHC